MSASCFYNAYPQKHYPDLPIARFVETTDPSQVLPPTALPSNSTDTAAPLQGSPTVLEQMKWDKYSLETFLLLLRNPAEKKDAEAAFKALIPPLKNTFYFWLWTYDRAPDKLEHGEKLLKENICRLLEIKDPYISLKGDNIVEQLIYSLDEKIKMMKIKKVVQTLHCLEEKSRNPSVDNAALVETFYQLPKKLQYELHGKVYQLSTDKPSGYAPYWGRDALEGDVRRRLALSDQGGSLLAQSKSFQAKKLELLFQEQKKVLKRQYEKLWANSACPYGPLRELYSHLDPEIQSQVNSPQSVAGTKQVVLPRVQRYKLYTEFGAHPTEKGTRFTTYAPHAKMMSVAITYHGITQRKVAMCPISENGVWEVEIEGIKPGTTYMYEITSQRDEKLWKLDPFSFKNYCYSGAGFNSIVCKEHDCPWTDWAWMEMRQKFTQKDTPISIYEIHVNSWKKNAQGKLPYKQIAIELAAYCKEMGFTHVELFGLLDHSSEGSWGYQPLSFFAPNFRHFNTSEGWESVREFQGLVDYLHSQGIGVILDWIPGHFDNHRNGLRDFDGSPIFEYPDHRQEWGASLFNYNSEFVRNYLLSSAYYWMQALHIDGIRLDALDPILGRAPHGDERNVKDFMQQLTLMVEKNFPGVLMIAECWRNNGITAPPGQGGFGFHRKWTSASGRVHEFMRYPIDQRKGRLSDITDAPFQDGREQLIWHTDHDKTRASTGSLYKQMPGDHLQKIANLRLWYSYFMTLPGKKMFFMGDELAQVEDWDSRMRKGIWEKPSLAGVQWEMQDKPEHRGVQEMLQKLNKLYTSLPDLHKESGLRWINIDNHNNAIQFHRGNLACVCNFGLNTINEYNVFFPHHEQHSKGIKEMREVFNSDDREFGGSGKTNAHVSLIKNQNNETIGFRVCVPPLSTMIFEEKF